MVAAPDAKPHYNDTSVNVDQSEQVAASTAVAGGRMLNFCVRLFKRTAAIGGSVLTVWIIVGSVWFPEWWYTAIWKRELLSAEYVSFGWNYLLDNHHWLLFGVSTAFATVAVYICFKRNRFFATVDRIAGPAIIACTLLLSWDAIHLHQPLYGMKAELVDGLSRFSQVILDGLVAEAKPSPPEIVLPVDFFYIDSARVSGLLSEIEPDFIETERSVSASKKISGSAGVEAGPATLKGDAAREKQESSKFQRGDSSAERKCVQLLNIIYKNGSVHYFTTLRDFYAQQELAKAIEAGRNGFEEASKGYDPKNYQPIPPIEESPGNPSSEQRLAAAKQFAEWNQIFRYQARGFVLVEGPYHITRTNDSITFEEEFSPPPQHIEFRLTLPARFDSDLFRDGSRMRVFGDVVQSQRDPTVLTIHPLAIY